MQLVLTEIKLIAMLVKSTGDSQQVAINILL